MPAPIVYAFAIVAGVGAIWAFKQFVYDPHLHDQVVTWAEELQDSRRRRRAQPHQAPGARRADDSDDDTQPLVPPPAPRQQPVQAPNGLLRRRRQPGVEPGHDSDEERYGAAYGTPPRRVGTVSTQDIELADLAPEIREWNSPASLTETRSPLDESNHRIPFAPLHPSRGPSGATELSPRRLAEDTHVIANEDSPATTPTSTPSMVRRMQALPQVPQPDHHEEQARSGSPAHTDLSSLVTSPPLPPSFLPPTSTRPGASIALDIPRARARAPEPEYTPTAAAPASLTPSLATPVAATPLARPIPPYVPSESGSESTRTLSSPATSISPTSYRQTFPARTPTSPSTTTFSSVSPPPLFPSPQQPRPPLTSNTTPASPPLRPAFVPSLSQIYPQELDAEHNIVLLSPPSSRSESPFSVVSAGPASPRGLPARGLGFDSRSPLIGQLSASNISPEAQEAPSTPGSTATSYLSLADDASTSASTPTSPTTRLHARHNSDEGSESDFDIISDTTSISALNSPFSMSPFASPRIGPVSGLGQQLGPPGYQQHQQQLLSPSPSQGHAQSRSSSPAHSETSTSELDILEYNEPWN